MVGHFLNRIDGLRRRVLDADNGECFIERESILADHAAETLSLPAGERYVAELRLLVENLSTPIAPGDEFAGRMVMGRWTRGVPFREMPDGLGSEGHITIPLDAIFARGLEGFSADARIASERIATDEARFYARQATAAATACRRFASRYADAAEAAGRARMAQELRRVPQGPAFDFHSALQSAWMVQFIMSCIVGARDFAPGRLDQSLLPFYRADIAAGRITREQALEWLALFFVKFNEIAGTATDNFNTQPTPCFSSKQYLTLGGTDAAGNCAFNELTELIVEAAELARLPQPTLNFRIDPTFPDDAWRLVSRAAASLGPQCNFFNDGLIARRLESAGFGGGLAHGYTFTACNRVDLPGFLHNRMCRIDNFLDSVSWLREAVAEAAKRGGMVGAGDVLESFKAIARARLADECRWRENIWADHPLFHLESLFIGDCNAECRDISRGGGDRRWIHFMFCGIATMADSLCAIGQLVDVSRRMSLADLAAATERNFEGDEDLLRELRDRMPKYGNGDERADSWARLIADVLLDAADAVGRETGFHIMPSFYSLEYHNMFGARIGATPDGRLAGEPISENQSPVHGMDRSGPLALLRSVSRLPFDRCICGGLNLRLSTRPTPEVVGGMLRGYFGMGGQHVGFTFVTRGELEAARLDPASFRTLMVRKTGFSEFFVALSPAEQQEMIDRTEFSL